MDTHGFQVIGMMEHDSFRFAGRPGSIYDGSQIFRHRFIHTDLYRCLGVCIIAQPEEIVKINRSLVFGVQLDCRIKHNQALQILGIFLYLECIIILQLFADKQSMYMGIINYILDLPRRIRRIHRNRDHTVRIGPEIRIKTLWHILRINPDIFLYFYPEFSHSLSRKHYFFRKFLPRYF